MNAAQRKFLAYVEMHQPKSVKDLKPKYHPRYIDEGAYRQVYDVRVRLLSLELVIKFPIDYSSESVNCGIEHARDEVKAIERINTEDHLLALRRYMPEVLYFDSQTGVTVMPKYKRIPWSQRFYGFADTFDCMLADLMPEMRYEFDSGNANFGLDKKERYVLLDAGLIGAWYKNDTNT